MRRLYEVLNTAPHVVLVVVDGVTLRFNAREKKAVEKHLVEHEAFKKHPELVIVRNLEILDHPQPVHPEPQPAPEEPEAKLVDSPAVEHAEVLLEQPAEKKPKARKKRAKSE